MKKQVKHFKKIISTILTLLLAVSSVMFAPTATFAETTGFSTVGGWNEFLYAEWYDSNPDSTSVKVGYKLSSDSSYTYLSGDDYTYLIREDSQTSGLARVDIPGLEAGTYDIEITDSQENTFSYSGITVYENDRSGYAHWTSGGGAGGYTDGVGAYNDDGTLKDNAVVIYVTEDTKNSVQLTYSGTTVTGIGNILNSKGASSTSSGESNTNGGILKTLAANDIPLVVRIVGEVVAGDSNTSDDPPDENIDGLTAYNSSDYGGTSNDNGMMAIMQNAKNITIEGIGDDASVNGWGFSFVCGSSAYKNGYGNSFELRNIYFVNYPEDAFGAEGTQSGDYALSAPVERVWVHNNTFGKGYCKSPAESDKGDGDGSCDFKRGQYYTNSYNHYINCHKTNLVGIDDEAEVQFYVTFHHNYYESVYSRQPLAGSGNIHIYSTYFVGAGSTTVDTRYYNAAFLEENYYENCESYFISRNSTCTAKSYNEVFSGGSIGTVSGARTVASSRTESGITGSSTVVFPDDCLMTDFDMNTEHFYYNESTQASDVSVLTLAADVPNYVPAHAGILQAFDEYDVNSSGTQNTTTNVDVTFAAALDADNLTSETSYSKDTVVETYFTILAPSGTSTAMSVSPQKRSISLADTSIDKTATTNRISTGGAGSTSQRAIVFTTGGSAGYIYVYALSSGETANERYLKLSYGDSTDNSDYLSVTGSSETDEIVFAVAANTTYYLYGSANVSIYYIGSTVDLVEAEKSDFVFKQFVASGTDVYVIGQIAKDMVGSTYEVGFGIGENSDEAESYQDLSTSDVFESLVIDGYGTITAEGYYLAGFKITDVDQSFCVSAYSRSDESSSYVHESAEEYTYS